MRREEMMMQHRTLDQDSNEICEWWWYHMIQRHDIHMIRGWSWHCGIFPFLSVSCVLCVVSVLASSPHRKGSRSKLAYDRFQLIPFHFQWRVVPYEQRIEKAASWWLEVWVPFVCLECNDVCLMDIIWREGEKRWNEIKELLRFQMSLQKNYFTCCGTGITLGVRSYCKTLDRRAR